MQNLKELINLSNFQLFASSIEGNIRHQKLRNCCVAKKLMSRTSPVNFGVFRREFLRNHSMNWTQIFRENLNCYSLSIFRVFILLASSDSDKHMLMRQKVQTKIRLYSEMYVKGWFPYDRKRSQTIADRRRSRIVDRRRSQRDLFPYNRRRSQTIAEPTVAIHFVQRKCHMYSRVVLAGKSKQTTWRTSRRKFCCKLIYFFF